MIAFDCTTPLPSELKEQDLQRTAQVLAHVLEETKSIRITLTCVSLGEMQALNEEHMGKDRPTDVLSFPADASIARMNASRGWIEKGDIVLCPDYARDEADRRGVEAREEFVRLIAHGVLHIYGFDHAQEDEELRMFSLQERVVGHVIDKDPL